MDGSLSVQISQPKTIQVPIEVCEYIINMLYSGDVAQELDNFAALRSCALVCRDWSIRAQIRLFHFVHLPDLPSLYRFAAALRAKHYLGTFVHEVSLIGHTLHTSASTLSVFPVVFAGMLPNLEELYVQHIAEDETWYPKPTSPSDSKNPAVAREPKTLPLSTLGLDNLTFASFVEFARLVRALPNLSMLRCNSVQWKTIGPVPAFMQRAYQLGLSESVFAPNLQALVFLDSSVYGAERLITACGPQLRRLDISIPLADTPETLVPDHESAIDLGACSELQELYVVPTWDFLKNTENAQYGVELLKTMLASWNPQLPGPTLTIGAYYQSWNFTRQQFADILHILGAVAEQWLHMIQSLAHDRVDSGDGPDVRYWVDIVIYDWRAQREWWWSHVVAYFPTWVKLGRLEMDYYAPPAPNYQWAPDPAPDEHTPDPPRDKLAVE
ncbi:hypothetical protein GSI_08312 [Ganoderma sinense ZZ0214-1]|uniref:F-box domain-containing protein n=1 Tax=Ganoderma sinense ZZ0214-1 TaxID=1077348 RepID=A0A2G8S6Y2_9APHY|nr:hypothetical protein GSI_08312 [Ganoderma sinense ZZ0214-1]